MGVPNHYDLVQAFASRYGTPNKDDDDARRAWTYKVAQTLAARCPGEGWGTKKSSDGAPQSADVVCTYTPFEGVDLLNGTTGAIQWSETGPLTGQIFIGVPAHDWLAETVPTPAPTPTPTPTPTPEPEGWLQLVAAVEETNTRLAEIAVSVKALGLNIDAVRAQLAAGIKFRF